jgi:tetratricopeptide (TPR) repeat protein
MLRSSLCGLLLCTLARLAAAQDGTQTGTDDAWKNLILQGTYLSVDAHDNAKAEQVFEKALHEAEHFGPNDVRVGATENRLGMVQREEKKFGDAEAAFRKALAVFEEVYGADSIDVANINFNMGSLLLDQGKAESSMSYLQKSLTTYRQQFGDTGLKTASVLCLVGDAYSRMKAWREAEKPLKTCAAVREQDGGVVNAEFGDAENSLALVFEKEGKYALADSAFKMAEKIRERTQGISSAALADTLEAHAGLLREMGRDADAEKDTKMATAIRKLLARTGK